jgi:hypothetical protein
MFGRNVLLRSFKIFAKEGRNSSFEPFKLMATTVLITLRCCVMVMAEHLSQMMFRVVRECAGFSAGSGLIAKNFKTEGKVNK